MNSKLELLRKVLKPVSKGRAEEIVRTLARPGGHEQLTLEDAGLVDEVREVLARRRERPQATEVEIDDV
jgi:hypothetical protein